MFSNNFDFTRSSGSSFPPLLSTIPPGWFAVESLDFIKNKVDDAPIADIKPNNATIVMFFIVFWL